MYIDMHCHLLPGVDDGSNNEKECVEILNCMKQSGVERLYFTPHLYSPNIITDITAIKSRYYEFREICIGLGIEPELGSEVFLRPEAVAGELIPLGETPFVLVELPANKPAYLYELVGHIQQRGYVIILAHIERYNYLFERQGLFRRRLGNFQMSSTLKKLRDMGVYFQINWKTVLNIRDRRYSPELSVLFESGYIDFIGSDKHSMNDGRATIDFEDTRYSLFRNQYSL